MTVFGRGSKRREAEVWNVKRILGVIRCQGERSRSKSSRTFHKRQSRSSLCTYDLVPRQQVRVVRRGDIKVVPSLTKSQPRPAREGLDEVAPSVSLTSNSIYDFLPLKMNGGGEVARSTIPVVNLPLGQARRLLHTGDNFQSA